MKPTLTHVTTLETCLVIICDAELRVDFVQDNCGDRAVLDSAFSRGFDAVTHFVLFIQAGKSV